MTSTATAENQALSGKELTAANLSGSHQVRLSRPARYGERVFSGRIKHWNLPSGLSIHLSDGWELAQLVSSVQLPAKLSIVLLLEGQLEFELDHRSIKLQSQPNRIQCAALILPEPVEMRRQLHRHTRVRKVQVSVELDWLTAHYPALSSLVSGFSAVQEAPIPHWTATEGSTKAALAILNQTEEPNALQTLNLESHALTILAESLNRLSQIGEAVGEGRQRSNQINAVRAYIEQRLEQHVDLNLLAKTFGMSISTLQRHFRRANGLTVGEYLRRRRLERARSQLLSGTHSVSEAAFEAGYYHSANFSAAYKKAFGKSPGADSTSSN